MVPSDSLFLPVVVLKGGSRCGGDLDGAGGELPFCP